jgi:hypothetical protein
MRGQETDERRVKEHTDKLSMKLDGYEAILSKQKYLAGDVSAPFVKYKPQLIDPRGAGTHHGRSLPPSVWLHG